MREKWKALTKRERRLFAAALVFLASAVLLRFVPGLRFSALLCLCAAAVLFVLFVLERAARRGSRAAVWGRRVLRALLAAGFVLFAALETMVIRLACGENRRTGERGHRARRGRERRNAVAHAAHAH